MLAEIESGKIEVVDSYELIYQTLCVMQDLELIEVYAEFPLLRKSRSELGGDYVARPRSLTPLWTELLDLVRTKAGELELVRLEVGERERRSRKLSERLGNARNGLLLAQRLVREAASGLLLRIDGGLETPLQYQRFLTEFVSAYYALNYVEFGEQWFVESRRPDERGRSLVRTMARPLIQNPHKRLGRYFFRDKARVASGSLAPDWCY